MAKQRHKSVSDQQVRDPVKRYDDRGDPDRPDGGEPAARIAANGVISNYGHLLK